MRSIFGITSIGFGAPSIVMVSIVQYWESMRTSASAHLLNMAEHLGWIHPPLPYAEDELRPSGLLPFTDETALLVLLTYGIYLGFVSVLFSLWAEYRREDNLYLSAGFVCGAGGIFLASKSMGIWIAALATVSVLLLRHVRRARPLR